MTHELEAILNRIGWATVKFVAPFLAGSLAARLTPNGGLFESHRPTARAGLERHQQLMTAMAKVLEELEALSPGKLRYANWASSLALDTPDARDVGVPDRVSQARAALEAIVPGILSLNESLAWEAELREGNARRGRPPNRAAYRIAEALAEVYVIGMGKTPPLGRDSGSNEANGGFATTFVDVCKILGVRVKDPHDVCEAAKEKLTPERVTELLGWRTGRNLRRLSLFDVSRSRMGKS